jgi:CBS domain containing-hemolysin-like protein
LFSGKVNIDEVRQRLDVDIERDGFETVGGFLLARIGRVPAVGETFDIDGLRIEILDAERRRINRVRICRRERSESDENAAS